MLTTVCVTFPSETGPESEQSLLISSLRLALQQLQVCAVHVLCMRVCVCVCACKKNVRVWVGSVVANLDVCCPGHLPGTVLHPSLCAPWCPGPHLLRLPQWRQRVHRVFGGRPRMPAGRFQPRRGAPSLVGVEDP